MVEMSFKPTEATGTTLDGQICKQLPATKVDNNNYYDYRIPNLEFKKIV